MSTQADEPPVSDTLRGHLRRFRGGRAGFRWEDVPLKHYKNEGTHFKDITRQTLFGEEDGHACELRYFEITPGGHSTFERHDHTHAVVILSGKGRVIVGEEIADVAAFDLLHVPPRTWHQLQAADDALLGFLCLVPCDRDRPSRPTAEERDALRAHPFFGTRARL